MIRFVPHLVHRHFALITFCDSLDIFNPRVHNRTVRKKVGVKVSSVVGINRIAVAQAHPRVDSEFNQPVNVSVQPVKFIFALLLFGLCPPALKPGIAYTCLRDILFELFKMSIVPVHRLASDAPPRRTRQVGVAILQMTDEGQRSGMCADVVPSDGGCDRFLGG